MQAWGRLCHICFPVNFAKFATITYFIEHPQWLLLIVFTLKNLELLWYFAGISLGSVIAFINLNDIKKAVKISTRHYFGNYDNLCYNNKISVKDFRNFTKHIFEPRKFEYWLNRTNSDASNTNLNPTCIYLFKVKNGNTRTTCEISCRCCCLYC